MAGQLRLWPYVAALGFFALALSLRAWRSRAVFLFWLRSWIIWFCVAFVGALCLVQLLRSVPVSNNWSERWAVADWQLNLWFFSTLPAYLLLPHDLRAKAGGFERSEFGLLLGAALGPWLTGAYPFSQLVGFAVPFLLLALVFYFLPGSRRGFRAPLMTLVAFNLVDFVHGIVNLPEKWASSILVLVLAIGLNPYGAKAAIFASVLGLASLFIKPELSAETAWISLLWTSAAIVVGWWLAARPGRTHA